MKLLIRLVVTLSAVIIGTAALGYFLWYRPAFSMAAFHSSLHGKPAASIDNNIVKRLKERADMIFPFALANHYNTMHCFMVDMHMQSGKKRFFVYNLQKDSVEQAGLVAHGYGSDKGGEDLCFSNDINSNCTSVGKYKIGKPYTGSFGLSYKLYGLDKTNNNAYNRFVVLHSYPCIPYREVSPLYICESRGCPMVAPAFLQELKGYIDHAEQPILLWIYY